jgi:hypothetical protein
LSKRLATIDVLVDIKDFKLENYKFSSRQIIDEKVIDLFKKFEFKSLIPEEHKSQVKNF